MITGLCIGVGAGFLLGKFGPNGIMKLIDWVKQIIAKFKKSE